MLDSLKENCSIWENHFHFGDQGVHVFFGRGVEVLTFVINAYIGDDMFYLDLRLGVFS